MQGPIDPEIYTILPDGRIYQSYLVDTKILSPVKSVASPEKSTKGFTHQEIQFSPQRNLNISVNSSPSKMHMIQMQQVPNAAYMFPLQNGNILPLSQQKTNYVQNLVHELKSGKTERMNVQKYEAKLSSPELDDNLKNRFIKEMDSIIDAFQPNLTSRTFFSERTDYQEYQRIHKESNGSSFVSRPTYTTLAQTPHRQSFITRQFPEENLIECVQAAINGYSAEYHHLNTHELIEYAKSLYCVKAGVDNVEVRDTNGKLIYGGGIYNGNIEGFGIIFNPFKVFKSINIKNINTLAKAWDSYEGYFKEGRFHGKGTLIINGERIVGDFCDGILNSQAMLEGKDGSRFVGNWRNNQLDEQ